jgi:hypothetical protein
MEQAQAIERNMAALCAALWRLKVPSEKLIEALSGSKRLFVVTTTGSCSVFRPPVPKGDYGVDWVIVRSNASPDAVVLGEAALRKRSPYAGGEGHTLTRELADTIVASTEGWVGWELSCGMIVRHS